MSIPIPEPSNLCFPVDWSCDQDFYDDLMAEEGGPAVVARAESFAALSLRMLTGYQLGGCPVVVRPCSPRCVPSSWLVAPVPSGDGFGGYVGLGFTPYIANGSWFNGCGCRADDCSCTTLQKVNLPGWVGSVTEVTIDGVLVPPSVYRVDNGTQLIRTDGGSWPSCQDMNVGPDEEGSFTVTYAQGIPVDGNGAYAAGVLAREFALACRGGACSLPPGVVQVARSGITIDLAVGSFPGGMTGNREVDLYVQSMNPYAVRSMAEVFSPDVPRARRTTWSA